MDDFPAWPTVELHAQMQENWYRFLKLWVDTCLHALDFGNMALAQGDSEYAAQETRAAEKGYAAVRRFLPGLDSAEQRGEIEAMLPPLRNAIDILRNKLGLSHETQSGAA